MLRHLPSTLFTYLAEFWNRATNPFTSVLDIEHRQHSKLLASLFLATVLTILVVMVTRFIAAGFQVDVPSWYLGNALTQVFLWLNFELSRRGFYRAASLIITSYGTSIILLLMILDQSAVNFQSLYYLSVLTVFASIFLPLRATLIVFTIHIIGMLAIPLIVETVTIQQIVVGPVVFYMVAANIMLLLIGHQRRLLDERQLRLAESEQRYKIISELISDYAFSSRVEPDGTLVGEWLTESFSRVTGYMPDEINQLFNAPILVHPEDRQNAMEDVARVLNGESVSSEYRIITKSGEIHWVQVYRRPEWDENQQRVVRYYGVVQDITEHKQIELQQLKMTVERERMVVLREFVDAISHDFRTTLANIELSRYLVQRMLPEDEREKIQPKLESIRGNIERLTDQLENLQMISSLTKLNLRPGDLNVLIQTFIDEYQGTKAKNLSFSFTPADNLPLLMADQQDLSNAIRHLFDNAVTYSEEGGIIRVRTFHDEDFISLQVQDAGQGIDADHIPHIFDLFYRGDASRPIHSGGVGVGLSIVKMVVEAHNGTITVESQPGQGSVFTLSLPILPIPDTVRDKHRTRTDYNNGGR